MKRYIITLLSFLTITSIFIACEDEDAVRIPDVQTGATFRMQLQPGFDNFDASDLSTAKVVYSLFTVNDDIDRADVYVTLTTLEGDTLGPEIWKTYSQSNFDGDGAIRNEEITLVGLAEFFAVPADSLGEGDRLDVENIVRLTDGRVFPDTALVIPGVEGEEDEAFLNVAPGILQSASSHSFSSGFTSYVFCPFDASIYEGTYTVTDDCGRFDNVDITIEATGGPNYTMTYSLFGFDSRTMNFLLICDNIIVPLQGTGLSCSGVSVSLTNATPPGTYDITDPSVLAFILDYPNTNCVDPQLGCNVTFTKK